MRKKYSIGLIAIALVTAVAFCFVRSSLQPASARIQDGSVRFVSTSVLGMTFDQSVRVCVGTTDPRGPILDWFVQFSDQNGTLLFQLPEQRSPSDEWRCGEIARSMFPVAGDAGTGRAQVAMEIVVNAPAGTSSPEIVGSAELIVAPGKTEAYLQVQFQKVLVTSVNPASPSTQ
jgi:hypothetical protein